MILACLFSQNLTCKQGFVQKFTQKSHRVLEKVPYFLKMAIFDTLNAIPEFPVQSKITILILSFLSNACLSIILDWQTGGTVAY